MIDALLGTNLNGIYIYDFEKKCNSTFAHKTKLLFGMNA